MNKDFLVFDLETQRAIDEVGGWKNIPALLMSVGVVWDNLKQEALIFYHDQTEELIELLASGRPVIGFNHIKFDYPVLTGYKEKENRELLNQRLCHPANLDMLLDVTERLGHRLKLDSIAKATLAVGKSADGLQALEWWRKYQATDDPQFLQQIVDYCVQDVMVTRDVFLYGVEHGKVYYENRKQGGIRSVKVDWKSFIEGKTEYRAEEKPKQQSGEQITLF